MLKQQINILSKKYEDISNEVCKVINPKSYIIVIIAIILVIKIVINYDRRKGKCDEGT